MGGQWTGFFGLAPSLEDTQKAEASGTSYWDQTVAQTQDGNATWTTLTTGYGPPDLARDPAWEERLFAANNNGDTNHGGVIVSYDGGSTRWSDGKAMTPDLTRLELSPGKAKTIEMDWQVPKNGPYSQMGINAQFMYGDKSGVTPLVLVDVGECVGWLGP